MLAIESLMEMGVGVEWPPLGATLLVALLRPIELGPAAREARQVLLSNMMSRAPELVGNLLEIISQPLIDNGMLMPWFGNQYLAVARCKPSIESARVHPKHGNLKHGRLSNQRSQIAYSRLFDLLSRVFLPCPSLMAVSVGAGGSKLRVRLSAVSWEAACILAAESRTWPAMREECALHTAAVTLAAAPNTPDLRCPVRVVISHLCLARAGATLSGVQPLPV